MLSLWLLACSTPAPEPVPPEPIPTEIASASEAEDGLRYVMASTLNLRDEAGAKKGRLAVNTPLRVLKQEGPRSLVRVANGSEGWVATEYLGEQPLEPSDLLALAASSQDPELRLASLQRAAAIDPSQSTLSALQAEYLAQGDTRRAGIVAQQIAWPEHLKPAIDSHRGELEIEFPLSWEEPGTHEERMARTRARIPVAVGDPVWVLPAYGPAVQGQIASLEWMGRNECSGESAWVARIQATLPPGQRPLMVSLQPPPQSWSAQVPPPKIPHAQAAELLSAAVSAALGESYLLDEELYRDGPNWRVVVRKDRPPEENDEVQDSMFGYADRLEVITTPQGGTEVLSQSIVNLDREDFEDWRISRDLNGDGTPEELRFSDCNTLVYDQGSVQAFSIYRCCKC